MTEPVLSSVLSGSSQVCCLFLIRASGERGQVERRDGAAVHIQQQTAQPGTHLHLTNRYHHSQLAAPSVQVCPAYLWLSLSLATQHVDAHSLSSLCAFIKERRPLLVSLPRRPPQDLNRLPYVSLRTLRVNTLVHALLRVTHTHFSSGEWAWLIYCIS